MRKKAVLSSDDELIRKAVAVLLERLGPVDTNRFLTLPAEHRLESVKRHCRWQKTLVQETFFDKVFPGEKP